MEKKPHLPVATRFSFFLSRRLTAAGCRRDGTVNRGLLHFFDSYLTSPASSTPRNGVRTADYTVDEARKLWFRIFVPTEADRERLPVLVFFHGGGFVYMSADFKYYDGVCRRFARKIPAIVVSVNYRLAPEHRYPAQYDDGFDVLKYLDQRRDVLPEYADLSNCFLSGDSAGANLAHHVVKRFCESTGFSRLQIKGLISIQPFFGGEERTKSEIELAEVDPLLSIEKTDWMWRAVLPDSDRDHESINVSGPRAADISRLRSFPPTLVVIGGFDTLKDWQRRYYEWLKNSGKEAQLLEYPNMVHAFYVFPELPESSQLIAEVKDFIGLRFSKA